MACAFLPLDGTISLRIRRFILPPGTAALAKVFNQRRQMRFMLSRASPRFR
jgi:hypothetical protein